MRIKKSLILRKIGNKYILVEVCDENVNMTDVFSMNATAAELWKRMGEGDFSIHELAEWMCNRYDVTMDVATADIERQLDEWKSFGLLA